MPILCTFSVKLSGLKFVSFSLYLFIFLFIYTPVYSFFFPRLAVWQLCVVPRLADKGGVRARRRGRGRATRPLVRDGLRFIDLYRNRIRAASNLVYWICFVSWPLVALLVCMYSLPFWLLHLYCLLICCFWKRLFCCFLYPDMELVRMGSFTTFTHFFIHSLKAGSVSK